MAKKNEFIAPSFEEFHAYCIDNGYGNISKRAYYGYAEGEPPWHDSNGKQIRSWKQKLQQVWFNPKNKDVAIKESKVNQNISTAMQALEIIKNKRKA